MFWSLSLQLMPGETVIEDSTGKPAEGLKPTYSVFLTNRRVVFRFDGLGSKMVQSFLYDEVIEAQTVKRMFITYLLVKTRSKDYFLHVPAPEHWAGRIEETAKHAAPPVASSPAAEDAARKKREDLHRMLDALKKHDILTDAEYSTKVQLLDRITG
jgi:Na+-transporting NADH:ubiquinone oxidoreductase subunit NqrF